jgi:hypothetical protein
VLTLGLVSPSAGIAEKLKTTRRYGSPEHIEELVEQALELGATVEEVRSVCKTSPLCNAALDKAIRSDE